MSKRIITIAATYSRPRAHDVRKGAWIRVAQGGLKGGEVCRRYVTGSGE